GKARLRRPRAGGARQRSTQAGAGLRLLRSHADDRWRVRPVLDRGRSAAAGTRLRPAAAALRGERSRPPARADAADRDLVEGKLRADDAVLPAQRLRRDLAYQGFLPDRRRQGRLLQKIAMSPNLSLYLALALYACGTLVALASLFAREVKLQFAGLMLMISGWVLHTFWIGTICVRTHHSPLTNLPETAAFLSWTVFLVELILFIRYRVHAAAFFVYPLVLILLTISAVVSEPFASG